jgi:hypothetical protein
MLKIYDWEKKKIAARAGGILKKKVVYMRIKHNVV